VLLAACRSCMVRHLPQLLNASASDGSRNPESLWRRRRHDDATVTIGRNRYFVVGRP
jgi:hypothetical protein